MISCNYLIFNVFAYVNIFKVILITALIFALSVAVLFLVRLLSKLTFNGIDSYTSNNALKKKLRALSLLSAVLIPLIAYYESEALELYEANWVLVSVIFGLSLLTFIVTFLKRLSKQLLTFKLSALFIIIVSIIYIIAFQRNLNTTLVAEASILLLFSKVIFQKGKYILYFLIYLVIFLLALIFVFSPEVKQVSILFSTTFLSVLVMVSIDLVETSSVNSYSFADKILKSSDLFVLVADRSGNVVYVSNPLLEITGKKEYELLGKGWEQYRSNETDGEFSLKEKTKDVLDNDKDSVKYINQLRTTKGVIDIEWSDFPLEGKFMMSIGKDITDQLKYRTKVEDLSLVATSVTNGVVIVNEHDRVKWVNNQFEKLIGIIEEKIVNKDIIEILTPFNLTKGSYINNMAEIEPNSVQTIRIKDIRQKEKYFLLSNSIVKNKEGRIHKKILVWTDVSNQWKLEKRYRDIIDNAFDNIYTADPKGMFTYVNKGMEVSMKMTSEELIGTHYTELIHPEDKAETISFYKKQLKNRETYTYKEFRVQNKDGEVIWVGQNVRLVFDTNSTNDMLELHVVARNITENKRNREELKRLSFVAENTGNIVIILDADLKVEWVNETFTKVFGYQLGEVLGKKPGELLNGKNTSAKTLEEIELNLKNHKAVNTELINYDKVGNELWIEILMNPIFDESNTITNYVAVESDITDRKSKELLIKEQHNSIISSLNYGSIIQKATLPTKDLVRTINNNVFIYYQPKEIIGGDFYLMDLIQNDYGNPLEVYIVADCTGHGVPGAMLSVLCTGILKEAIKSSEVHNPADALNYTRNKLLEVFESSGGVTINDGMDLGICVVDRATSMLDYSGANRPLFIVSNDELKVVKGNKQSVGHNRLMKGFTHERIPFQKGDSIYLFSDGVVDQFGGPRNRKFMTSRFKKLLLEIKDIPIQSQLSIVKSRLESWKGEEEQTDDICLMGIKL